SAPTAAAAASRPASSSRGCIAAARRALATAGSPSAAQATTTRARRASRPSSGRGAPDALSTIPRSLTVVVPGFTPAEDLVVRHGAVARARLRVVDLQAAIVAHDDLVLVGGDDVIRPDRHLAAAARRVEDEVRDGHAGHPAAQPVHELDGAL